jgi:putative N6-adenine-specific DNA methylase
MTGEKAIARRIKDHVVGSRHDFFAVVHPGFEEVARQELRELGIGSPALQGSGGIGFSARLDDAWRLNLGAGTLSRLLMRLARFKATGFAEFRDKLAAVPWELHIAAGTRVSFSISAAASRLWHEGKLAEESAKAVRARLEAYGRPAGFAGVQSVFIRLDGNRCQVSLDSSGELLYRRGRGKFTEGAPLRETLACSALRAAEVAKYRVVMDPFCGSGTFALEAGAILRGLPVNDGRAFAFENWPCFRPARFRHVREELARELESRAPAGEHRICCSDVDAGAAATARRNLELAGFADLAEVEQRDFFALRPPAADPAAVLLVMNPPYGARLEKGSDIAGLYRRIGAKVRRDLRGCAYAIIVPGIELEKALGLPHEKKILFRNGGIPVALIIHHSNKREA